MNPSCEDLLGAGAFDALKSVRQVRKSLVDIRLECGLDPTPEEVSVACVDVTLFEGTDSAVEVAIEEVLFNKRKSSRQ